MPTVRDGLLHRRGLRLHYRDWGGDGRPVVLLHGLASNARIWDLTAPQLAGPLRVVAPDQRGHGLSEGPVLSAVEGPDGGYGFDDVCADLAAFIEALGLERPLLVGHSWGGNVALQFAADRPGEARGLVLVDGGFLELSALDGMTWERAQQVMAPPPLDGVPLDVFLEGAKRWPDLAPIWDDQVQEIVLANFEVDGDNRIRRRLPVASHMKILRSLWEQKPSTMWERLACPVLLIPATRDQGDPRSRVWMEGKRRAIELAERRSPAARTLWMEDTIHDIPLQRPRELARAIGEFADGLA